MFASRPYAIYVKNKTAICRCKAKNYMLAHLSHLRHLPAFDHGRDTTRSTQIVMRLAQCALQ